MEMCLSTRDFTTWDHQIEDGAGDYGQTSIKSSIPGLFCCCWFFHHTCFVMLTDWESVFIQYLCMYQNYKTVKGILTPYNNRQIETTAQ